MKYLLLLLISLPVQAHNNIVSAGYVFNDGLMLGYQSVHREKGAIGWYVNGIYAKNTNNNTQSGTFENAIQEYISNSLTTSTTTNDRAIKCNRHGKCHAFGPPITTTTSTTTTETVLVDSLAYEDILIESKVVDRDFILNLGANYSYRKDIFFYGGLGIAKETTRKYFTSDYEQTIDRAKDYKLNINFGALFNSDEGAGLNVGYNTINHNMYVGFSYEW